MQGEPPVEAPFLVEYRKPSVIRGIGHRRLDEAAQVRGEEGWGGWVRLFRYRVILPLSRLRERVE
jgi:hypothetical protein